MSNLKTIAKFILVAALMITGCNNNEVIKKEITGNEDTKTVQEEEDAKKVEYLNHAYFKVPDGRILDMGDGTALYSELKQRFKKSSATLKQLVEASGAKLVYVILTPEVGKTLTPTNRYGNPYIRETCNELGIECLDLTSEIAAQEPKNVTQVPRDGHWSAKGAKLIAAYLATFIRNKSDVSCKVTYNDAERSKTFGDLPPNDNEVMDGEKGIPYHVQANSQGLRMNHDVVFPKKKKHIFLMGDSGFFCPFLDNQYTISSVLQEMLPNDEIMNAAMIGYTIEDYITLWNEKAKYAEPDLVLVQTDGGDITDMYFTNRNHFSRSKKPFLPTENEKKFYKDTYMR